MKLRNPLFFALPSLALMAACGGQAVETTDLTGVDQSALELPYGGIDESDEAPMFGDASFDLLAEADEDPAADESFVDETESDPAAVPTEPDVAKVVLTILWGNLRPDAAETDVTDWTGRLVAEGAGIVGVRTIRFEDRDQLLPRSDRGMIAWVSHTRPHHDGISVLLRVPLTSTTDRLGPMVRFETRPFSVSIPLRQLADHHRIVDVGDNQVAFSAFVLRPNDCPSGRLAGHWAPQNERGIGHFYGRWMGAAGRISGHVRGIYGQRADGSKVFFGKVIGPEGRFIGRLGGRYGEGEFRGRYEVRGGHEGGVRGRYMRSGDRPGGVFAGRWAELCRPEGTTMPTEDLPETTDRP